MKVLVVSQYFPPEPSRIGDFAAGLAERGHDVTVLTGKPNYPGGDFYPGYGFLGQTRERRGGVEVVRVPLVPRGSGSAVRMALNYLSYALLASALGPLLCRGRYDLVFVCQLSPFTVALPGLVFKYLKRAPMMLWVQDLWPESLAASGVITSRQAIALMGWVVRCTYRRCDRILVVSEGFVASIKARGADPEKIRHWPQWAESLYRPVAPDPDSPEAREMPAGFKVVFAGNVGAGQGVETAVEAAQKLRRLPNLYWIVIGDGRMRPSLEARVRELGLGDRFRFLGARPMRTMPVYFAHADVLLMTLKREPIFALTAPGKLQSYLACGRPVIAALDGEGARVVEEAGAGLTASAEDAEALAAAVLKLYGASPEERSEMGRRGRAYSEEHFEREMLLDRLEGWMQKLTKGRAPK